MKRKKRKKELLSYGRFRFFPLHAIYAASRHTSAIQLHDFLAFCRLSYDAAYYSLCY